MGKFNSRRAVFFSILLATCPASAADLFWVGGNTNWTDPNANGAGLSNWSLSSGGAPQANIPNIGGEAAIIDLGGSVTILSSSLAIDRLDVLHPTASFTFRAIPGFNNTLFLSGNSQNAGTINLTADGGGSGLAQMTMTGGSTFNNTGTFNFAAPTSGGSNSRAFSGLFVSSGTVNVSANADFNSGAAATNTGTFTVTPSGQVFSTSLGVFNQNAGTLANNGAFLVTSGDTFNFNGGNITGNPIEIQSSTLNIGPGSTGSGTFRFINNNTHSGNVAAAQTLIISGFSGINTNVTAGSFTNAGTMNFTAEGGGAGVAQLTLTSGNTLTNSGTINFQAPVSGGQTSRIINGNLTSSGTMNVAAGITTTFASGTGTSTTNTGTMTIAATGSVLFGTSSTFVQAGGTITNNGTFQLDGDTFNFTGGSTTGNAISLNNSTLNLSAGAGNGLFQFTGSSNTLTGNTKAGQTFTVLAPPGVNTTLAIPASISSAGVIDLLATGGGSGVAQINITSPAVLTNTGTVNFKTPTANGSTSRALNGNFTSTGTVNVETSTTTTFGGTSATYTNSGSFNVASGATLNFGTSATFTLSGGTLNNLGTFQLSSDTFNFTGGTTTGNAIALSNSTLNLSAGAGNGSFFFTDTTNSLTGNAKAGQTFTVLAPPGVNTTLTIPASISSAGVIDLLATGGGSGFVQINITGPAVLTNTGTVNFKTPTANGSTSRALNGNFTSTGTVNVENSTSTIFGGTSATYTNGGMFTVQAGASLGFGTTSTFTQNAGTLANSGSFTMEGDTFNFNGGQTTGNPIVLSNSTLNHGPAATGPGNFSLVSSSNLNGNIAPGETVNVIATPGVNTSVTATTLTNNGILTISTTGGGSGASNLTFPGANSLTNHGQINILPVGSSDASRLITAGLVNNGTYFQSGGTAHTLGPITGTGTMTIAAGNTAATRLVQSSLSLSGSSRLTIAANSLFNSVNSLTITDSAVLNLTNNDLTIDYTGTSIIAILIGLYSNDRVIANASSGGLPTYLAISEAADLGLSEFNGQTIDDTTVIAKFTYVGDANLDGQVDALDYERIDLAIGNTGVFGTAQGDLNYDGNVDALDYEQVDLNIGNGVGSPLAQVFIPEPTGVAFAIGLAGAVSRRRR